MSGHGSKHGQRPNRLGRGLSSLVGPAPVRVDQPSNTENAVHITNSSGVDGPALIEAPVDAVSPNPHQPRRVFDDASLGELAASIRADGVMQPIVVRNHPSGNGYELVAGERRLRAARMAGLATVPAIVRAIDDRASAELALIENLQRADLNPVERASAFRALIDRHGMTQSALGARLGIDRAVVSNHLRLLELDDETLAMVGDGRLSYAHGRALAGVADPDRRRALAQRAMDEGMSVRAIEREAAERAPDEPVSGPANDAGKPGTNTTQTRARAVLDDMERNLSEHLGTRVTLTTDRTGTRGRVSISFFSLDEFDGILARLGYRDGGM